jgi:nitrogen fixation/metabolism regulation signal transduction histidine kinase
MATDAQSIPKSGGKQPKRRLRNFLLDRRFQLKYTGMVVLVTVVTAVAVTTGVGGWLGNEAYKYSQGMSEMLLMQRGGGMAVDDELQQLFEDEAHEQDEQVKSQIINGIVLMVVVISVVLTLALGVTGIVVTHKVVGPAYKLKLLLGKIEEGNFNVRGGFRKGDELQDVGEAFKRMVASLRERREEELTQLEEAIEEAKSAGADEAVLEKLDALKERLEATLRG